MKITLAIASICAALISGGCYHMETASTPDFRACHMVGQNGDPAEHAIVSNYGWYFFNKYPIVCGNPDQKAFLPFSFFSDYVSMPLIQDRLTRHAAEAKLDVVDVSAFRDSSCMIPVPIANFTIPVPCGFLWMKEVRMSAILAKHGHVAGSTPTTEMQRRKLSREMNRLLESLPDGNN